MGGGSSSSNTSTVNNTDASTVSSNQAGTAAGVVGDRNRTSVNILDGGAIRDAFGFGVESLETLNNSVTDSLDFSRSVVGGSLDTVDGVVNSGFDFAEDALNNSFEFGADSTDAAFAFSTRIAEQSSIENRSILNSAINASNDAQSSVLKFAQNVSTPQTQLIKAGLIGLAIFATASIFLKRSGAA